MSLQIGPVYGVFVDADGDPHPNTHVGDNIAMFNGKGKQIGIEFRSLHLGVPDSPTHRTTFLPEAFLAELTEDEFDLLDASNNATVKKFMRRLEGRQAGLVTVTPKYVSDIGELLTQTIISQARHDDLIQGLPV